LLQSEDLVELDSAMRAEKELSVSTDQLIKATQTLQDYQFGSQKPVKPEAKRNDSNDFRSNLFMGKLNQL
jgi:hypothetical protein